jgi:hypothetical protein
MYGHICENTTPSQSTPRTKIQASVACIYVMNVGFLIGDKTHRYSWIKTKFKMMILK